MHDNHRRPRPLVAALVLTAASAATLAGPAAGASALRSSHVTRVHGQAVTVTNVIVQGGTTPTDSGLMQAVIEPGFAKAYPQFNLIYVPVGTAQAIANAEAGQADAVFTHSAAAESSFVSSGYSYEPGGRLVMTSDFVTVGSSTDSAGVSTGPANNVVDAFCEIAAAGSNGHAEFISRGDGSGTNAKELSIWALAASASGCPSTVSLNSLGEPGTPGTTTTDAWYHTTGLGQGANLAYTNQCNYASANCYTIADRGTFAAQQQAGTVASLSIVSQLNTATGALGGAALLVNPYHAYAVNPAKEPGVHVNLAGALAFLNYLTSPATQAAIGAYPSTSNPAFTPDARPTVALTSTLPTSVSGGTSVTIGGTDLPAYYLDPSNAGAPVLIYRKGAPSTTIASTTVSSTGTFSLTFMPTTSDNYFLYFAPYADGLVLPGNSGYRQALTVSLGHATVKSSVTLTLGAPSGLSVPVSGNTLPTAGQVSASVTIQYKSWKTSWTTATTLPVATGATGYAGSITLPTAGKWSIRAQYTDPGNVAASTSAVQSVTVS